MLKAATGIPKYFPGLLVRAESNTDLRIHFELAFLSLLSSKVTT